MCQQTAAGESHHREEKVAHAASHKDSPFRLGDLLRVLSPPADPRHQERRSKQRFPIRMDVTYQVIDDRSTCGKGLTLNISSAAVRFTTEGQQLSPGDLVELTAPWPVLLNGRVSLKLIIRGVVVRAGSAEAVATIKRYEYRTCHGKRV